MRSIAVHCFQKKSQKTGAADLSIAAKRLAQVVEQIKEGER
ncbi:type II toxin-antitoxin system RelE/ParE family toxin [Nocardia brasiliensis]